jgi:hypothetical protein
MHYPGKGQSLRCLSLVALVTTLAACQSDPVGGPNPIDSTRYTLTIDSDGVDAGKNAYQIFVDKLGPDPVDGPESDHIWETVSEPVGSVFQFILHAEGDVDPSYSDRQRNEVKVYNRSDKRLQGFEGTTFTYRWKFRIDPEMAISTRFAHLFQIKPVGGDEVQPILTFTVANDQFQVRYLQSSASSIEYLSRLPYASAKGVWLDAAVTAKNSENGTLSVTIKKLDGSVLVSHSSNSIDMWRGSEFNRPKWGIYRGLFDGMGEAKVQFANFSITRH